MFIRENNRYLRELEIKLSLKVDYTSKYIASMTLTKEIKFRHWGYISSQCFYLAVLPLSLPKFSEDQCAPDIFHLPTLLCLSSWARNCVLSTYWPLSLHFWNENEYITFSCIINLFCPPLILSSLSQTVCFSHLSSISLHSFKY